MQSPNYEDIDSAWSTDLTQNKIGSHSDPVDAEKEFREYGRLQMEDWVSGIRHPDL
jgi:hypothetical protein